MPPFVLEGLRRLPWLQLQRRRNPDAVDHLFDCGNCKKRLNKMSRQAIGCAYEEVDPRFPVQPWDHFGRSRYPGESKTCPGFSCSLPEVIETTWASYFLDKGELTQFCEGQASPQMLDALIAYAASKAAADEWDHKNPEKT